MAAKPKKDPPKTSADFGFVDAFLNAHKDVKAKVNLAIKNGWTPERLQGSIKTTTWWKTRTDAQRQYDLIIKENPKEAARQIALKREEVQTAASNLGVTLTAAEMNSMATAFYRDGSSQAEVQARLAANWDMGEKQTGQAAIAVDDIRQTAADYGVRLAPATQEKYTRQILAGDMDAKGWEDMIREQAKMLYAPISAQLDQGKTVKDVMGSYLQIAGSELGMDPEQMSLDDPRWTAAIYGENNAPMTAGQWTAKIRQDPLYGWDKTFGARQQASQLATEFGRAFGVV